MSRIQLLLVLGIAMATAGCAKAKPVAVTQTDKLKSEVAGKAIEKTPKPSPYKYKVAAERTVRPVATASREPAPKLRSTDDAVESQ